jgi:acyl-CoA reductase-like NAD-dependent aldehyde dehydrogenase
MSADAELRRQAPTVLDRVTPAMDVYKEEIFGPVLGVTPASGAAYHFTDHA